MNKRFDRHYKLYNFGETSQQILQNKKILIIGCGGIGCSTAINIISNGVGTVGLMDNDIVSLSNLHRQYGHSMAKIGLSKVDSLYIHCKEINPDCNIIRIHKWFKNDEYTKEIISNYDLILDCTDNPTTRLSINKLCKLINKPYIFASSIGWDAQLCLITPDGPCLECVFPELKQMNDTCTANGVLGPVPSLIGTLQAIECIKYLIKTDNVKEEEEDNPFLLIYSSRDCDFQKIDIFKDPNCNCVNTVNKEEEKEEHISIEYKSFLQVKKNSNDWLLVDLREDFNSDETLLDSLFLTKDKISKEWLNSNKNKNIYFICDYNELSKNVVETFRKEGYTNLFYIKEGMRNLF